MNPSARVDRDRIPRYLVGIAVVLAGATVCESVLRTFGPFVGPNGETVVFQGEFLVGVLTTLPFVAGIWYVGFRLPRSDLDADRYPRILQWLIRGAVLSLAFNLLLIAVIGATSLAMFVAWVRWSVAVGAGLGLAIGVSEAKAVQKSVEAELARSRTEHLTRQRDLLNYLNSFLRHEGLNTVQIISGHAKFLMEETDPDDDVYAHSETIYRRSEDLTDVITDIRLLIRAAHEETPLEAVDACEVLRREIRKIEDRDERIEVVESIPDEAHVRANALLKHVFGNLLTNAVEHNDSDVARIRVSMTRSEDLVAVEVADNGDGIPDDRVSELFARPDSFATDHGLGLFLIGELTAQYGGTIELVETGEDGSVFRVELPRIPPDGDERSVEPDAGTQRPTPADDAGE